MIPPSGVVQLRLISKVDGVGRTRHHSPTVPRAVSVRRLNTEQPVSERCGRRARRRLGCVGHRETSAVSKFVEQAASSGGPVGCCSRSWRRMSCRRSVPFDGPVLRRTGSIRSPAAWRARSALARAYSSRRTARLRATAIRSANSSPRTICPTPTSSPSSKRDMERRYCSFPGEWLRRVRSGCSRRSGSSVDSPASPSCSDVGSGRGSAEPQTPPMPTVNWSAAALADDARGAGAGGGAGTQLRERRGGRVTRVDLDVLAELEEERRFLLRSLADLEREHDAGDIDDVDYATLATGTPFGPLPCCARSTAGGRTSRRSHPDGSGAPWRSPRSSWPHRSASGSHSPPPGANARGVRRSRVRTPGDDARVLLANARGRDEERDFGGWPTRSREVVQMERDQTADHVEAIAYFGWTLALLTVGEGHADAVAQRLEAARLGAGQAIELEPEYADPYCFMAKSSLQFLEDARRRLAVHGDLRVEQPAERDHRLIEAFAATSAPPRRPHERSFTTAVARRCRW